MPRVPVTARPANAESAEAAHTDARAERRAADARCAEERSGGGSQGPRAQIARGWAARARREGRLVGTTRSPGTAGCGKSAAKALSTAGKRPAETAASRDRAEKTLSAAVETEREARTAAGTTPTTTLRRRNASNGGTAAPAGRVTATGTKYLGRCPLVCLSVWLFAFVLVSLCVWLYAVPCGLLLMCLAVRWSALLLSCSFRYWSLYVAALFVAHDLVSGFPRVSRHVVPGSHSFQV